MSTKAHDEEADTDGVARPNVALERQVVKKLDRNFLLLLWVLCKYYQIFKCQITLLIYLL